MKLKQFWLLLLTSVLLVLALTMLGAISHFYKFSISCIVYFIVTWRILNKFPEDRFKSLLILILPLIILYVPIHLYDFQQSRSSLPSSVAGVIGIGLGFLTWQVKRLRVVFMVSVLAIALSVHLYFYQRWLDYLNYGQFSMTMNEPIPQLEFINELGVTKGNEIFKNKIVVLDFWNTGCGSCFMKFPILQEMSDQTLDSKIDVYAVNIPFKRDTVNQSYQALRKYNYTFDNLVAAEQFLDEKMGVLVYPTTFIIVNDTIRFKGSLEFATLELEKLKKDVSL